MVRVRKLVYLLTAAGLFAAQSPGVVGAGVHAVVARVARAAAAVPGHGVAGGGGVAEGAVLGAPQPELSARTRVLARGARVARAARAGPGLVVTAAAATPALQAAVSSPAAGRADRGAPGDYLVYLLCLLCLPYLPYLLYLPHLP